MTIFALLLPLALGGIPQRQAPSPISFHGLFLVGDQLLNTRSNRPTLQLNDVTATVRLLPKSNNKHVEVVQVLGGVRSDVIADGSRLSIRRTVPGTSSKQMDVDRAILDVVIDAGLAGALKLPGTMAIAGAPCEVYHRRLTDKGEAREEWRWLLADTDLRPFVGWTKSLSYQKVAGGSALTDFVLPIETAKAEELSRHVSPVGCLVDYVELTTIGNGADAQPIVRQCLEQIEPIDAESGMDYTKEWEGHRLMTSRRGNLWKRAEFSTDHRPTYQEFAVPPSPSGLIKVTNLTRSSKTEFIAGVPCTFSIDRIEYEGKVEERWMWEATDPDLRKLVSPVKRYTYQLDGDSVRLVSAYFPLKIIRGLSAKHDR